MERSGQADQRWKRRTTFGRLPWDRSGKTPTIQICLVFIHEVNAVCVTVQCILPRPSAVFLTTVTTLLISRSVKGVVYDLPELPAVYCTFKCYTALLVGSKFSAIKYRHISSSDTMSVMWWFDKAKWDSMLGVPSSVHKFIHWLFIVGQLTAQQH